eukprot:GHVP01061956.1.p1 GENE.GHVP01061956.1~~GHVP01061956.1.p1  ORF type:complete len:1501 (+),score=245.06 GHVP01061956.1:492-4505(+)
MHPDFKHSCDAILRMKPETQKFESVRQQLKSLLKQGILWRGLIFQWVHCGDSLNRAFDELLVAREMLKDPDRPCPPYVSILGNNMSMIVCVSAVLESDWVFNYMPFPYSPKDSEMIQKAFLSRKKIRRTKHINLEPEYSVSIYSPAIVSEGFAGMDRIPTALKARVLLNAIGPPVILRDSLTQDQARQEEVRAHVQKLAVYLKSVQSIQMAPFNRLVLDNWSRAAPRSGSLSSVKESETCLSTSFVFDLDYMRPFISISNHQSSGSAVEICKKYYQAENIETKTPGTFFAVMDLSEEQEWKMERTKTNEKSFVVEETDGILIQVFDVWCSIWTPTAVQLDPGNSSGGEPVCSLCLPWFSPTYSNDRTTPVVVILGPQISTDSPALHNMVDKKLVSPDVLFIENRKSTLGSELKEEEHLLTFYSIDSIAQRIENSGLEFEIGLWYILNFTLEYRAETESINSSAIERMSTLVACELLAFNMKLLFSYASNKIELPETGIQKFIVSVVNKVLRVKESEHDAAHTEETMHTMCFTMWLRASRAAALISFKLKRNLISFLFDQACHSQRLRSALCRHLQISMLDYDSLSHANLFQVSGRFSSLRSFHSTAERLREDYCMGVKIGMDEKLTEDLRKLVSPVESHPDLWKAMKTMFSSTWSTEARISTRFATRERHGFKHEISIYKLFDKIMTFYLTPLDLRPQRTSSIDYTTDSPCAGPEDAMNATLEMVALLNHLFGDTSNKDPISNPLTLFFVHLLCEARAKLYKKNNEATTDFFDLLTTQWLECLKTDLKHMYKVLKHEAASLVREAIISYKLINYLFKLVLHSLPDFVINENPLTSLSMFSPETAKRLVSKIETRPNIFYVLYFPNEVSGIDGEIVRLPYPRTRHLEASQIRFGETHSCLIDTDGVVYMWGENEDEELGVPVPDSYGFGETSVIQFLCDLQNQNRNRPTIDLQLQHYVTIPTELSFHFPFIDVQIGGSFSIGLAKNGNVFSWGRNTCGCLGQKYVEQGDVVTSPLLISTLAHLTVQSISCSSTHCACVTEQGDIYTWGWALYGQTGIPESEVLGQHEDPSNKQNNASAMTFTIKTRNTCAFPKKVTVIELPEDETAFNQKTKELGLADQMFTMEIRRGKTSKYISTASNIKSNANLEKEAVTWQEVKCGRLHTVALDSLANVWTWGFGLEGQLGIGKLAENALLSDDGRHTVGQHTLRYTPCQIAKEYFFNRDIVSVETGGDVCAAVDDEENVWIWGTFQGLSKFVPTKICSGDDVRISSLGNKVVILNTTFEGGSEVSILKVIGEPPNQEWGTEFFETLSYSIEDVVFDWDDRLIAKCGDLNSKNRF